MIDLGYDPEAERYLDVEIGYATTYAEWITSLDPAIMLVAIMHAQPVDLANVVITGLAAQVPPATVVEWHRLIDCWMAEAPEGPSRPDPHDGQRRLALAVALAMKA